MSYTLWPRQTYRWRGFFVPPEGKTSMSAIRQDEIAEEDVTEAPDAAATDAEKESSRRSSIIDIDKEQIVIDGTVYRALGLDARVKIGLMLEGLRLRCLQHKDGPMEGYRQLQRGILTQRVPAKPVELDPWRRAIAQAIVSTSKRVGKPISLDDAEAATRGLNRAGLIKAKLDPEVIKFHRKLTGQERSSILDLLNPGVLAAD